MRCFTSLKKPGMNRELGYSSPADLADDFPTFYRNCVSMHIEDGLKLLNLTVSGRQWIANLNHHLVCAERSERSMGPQPGESTPEPSFVVNVPRASASIHDLKLRSPAGRANIRGSQSVSAIMSQFLGQRSLENRLIHRNGSPNVVALHSLAHRI